MGSSEGVEVETLESLNPIFELNPHARLEKGTTNHESIAQTCNKASFRRKPESRLFYNQQSPWMPDQVRHDGEKHVHSY